MIISDFENAFQQDFNQRAYLRIFGSVLFELNVPDPILDIIRPQVPYFSQPFADILNRG